MKKKSVTGQEQWMSPDDAPSLTREMLDQAETFEGNVHVPRKRGRPKSGYAKEQISVRIDIDVLEKLREAGPGWQSQINTLLRNALELGAISNGIEEEVLPEEEIEAIQNDLTKQKYIALVHDSSKFQEPLSVPE